jgi:hypothetical protein
MVCCESRETTFKRVGVLLPLKVHATPDCESSFLTTWGAEAKWIPNLKTNGKEVKFNPNPTFLGLTYDRCLSFAGHASATAKKVTRRSRALLHLGGTDWGYEKKTLKNTYIATSRSPIEYAGPAWQPWLAKTSVDDLEKAQRFAGRDITGQVKTTPRGSHPPACWSPPGQRERERERESSLPGVCGFREVPQTGDG